MSSGNCPECGQRLTRGIYRYPDGSSRRNVQRENCQAVLSALLDAYEQKDGLAAVEAFGELRNQAEEAFIWAVLSTPQRTWMRLELRVTDVQGGWDA